MQKLTDTLVCIDVNVWVNATEATGTTDLVSLFHSTNRLDDTRVIGKVGAHLVTSDYTLETIRRKTGASHHEIAELRAAIIGAGGAVYTQAELDEVALHVVRSIRLELLSPKAQQWSRTSVNPGGPESPEDKRIDFEDIMVLSAAYLATGNNLSGALTSVVTCDNGILDAFVDLHQIGLVALMPRVAVHL